MKIAKSYVDSVEKCNDFTLTDKTVDGLIAKLADASPPKKLFLETRAETRAVATVQTKDFGFSFATVILIIKGITTVMGLIDKIKDMLHPENKDSGAHAGTIATLITGSRIAKEVNTELQRFVPVDYCVGIFSYNPDWLSETHDRTPEVTEALVSNPKPNVELTNPTSFQFYLNALAEALTRFQEFLLRYNAAANVVVAKEKENAVKKFVSVIKRTSEYKKVKDTLCGSTEVNTIIDEMKFWHKELKDEATRIKLYALLDMIKAGKAVKIVSIPEKHDHSALPVYKPKFAEDEDDGEYKIREEARINYEALLKLTHKNRALRAAHKADK